MSGRDETPFAAPEVADEVALWLRGLEAERRLSKNTVEAYGRDVRQFLGFLAVHLGRRVTLAAFRGLPPDIRAFMAERRRQGIGGRSLMRSLAGARSFARALERQGSGRPGGPAGPGGLGALTAVRGPKLAKTLPKPLPVASAKRFADPGLRAGEEREPWVLARDAAVMALLYGCGLRISEALALKVKDIPAPGCGDAIVVTGKGNKSRMVPVLETVLALVADYLALCPYDAAPDRPAFVGTRGGPLSPRIIQLATCSAATKTVLTGALTRPKVG